ncbi:glycoprotein [Pectinophora gossypiella virus 2]|nr:glycoprotein [Pectinophora gossypiella virus 2]
MQLLIILITAVWVLPIATRADIHVQNGVLTIKDYNKCHININGDLTTIELNRTKYIHDTLVFGLLKWKCDNEFGNEIVDIQCKDCGIYCSYNQQFEKCKNNITPWIIGILTSLCVLLIIILISVTCLKKKINNTFLYIIFWLLTRNDRKRASKVKKLNKITGSRNTILFRSIITKSDQLNTMIMENRLKIRKEVTGDEPIYQEICQDEKDANRFSYELEKRVTNNPHHQRGVSLSGILSVGLLASTMVQPTYACDKTLYLATGGKICDDKTCTVINMYSIPIQTGSNVCFKTINGDKLEIKITNSKDVTRYQSSYYACSYKMLTTSAYECKSVNGNCWNNGMCQTGRAYPSLKLNSSFPHGYGCMSDTVGCDTWCWHQTSCTWYRWELVPHLQRCFKVYSTVSNIWQTSVIIKYKGITKHIKLNTNNPTYNLRDFNIEGFKEMPVFINSMNYEKPYLKRSVIMIDRTGYATEASEMNMPVKNTIGEYQMSLDKSSYTTYTSDPKCYVSSCNVSCVFDTPAVDRIEAMTSAKIPVGQLFYSGESVLKRLIPIMVTANLVLGSVELDSLYISPSHCKLSVEQSYACIGCDTKPQAIIKAYDIKNEGLLEFESNCSWTSNMMSCNPEPYIITLEQNSDICFVHLPTINQTIIINFEYIFTGKLSLLRTYYSESVGEAFETLMTDTNFWSGLMTSLNVMALMSVVTVAFVKVARLGIMYKTEKNLDNV